MKVRTISAIVLVAIFIPLIFIGGLPFSLAVGIVSLLSIKEIFDLKKDKVYPSIVKIFGCISLLWLIYSNENISLDLSISLGSLALVFILYLIPTLIYSKSARYTTKDAFYLSGWTIVLGLFYNAMIYLVDYSLLFLIFILLVTILNDVFALIFGKLIGKHKLLPSISPNKTIEGSICGIVFGSFVAAMFYYNVIDPSFPVFNLIGVVVILSIVGQMGDLIFSKVKREAHIKDFSKLIPGHGGILDRFDSLIFVVLVYILVMSL